MAWYNHDKDSDIPINNNTWSIDIPLKNQFALLEQLPDEIRYKTPTVLVAKARRKGQSKPPRKLKGMKCWSTLPQVASFGRGQVELSPDFRLGESFGLGQSVPALGNLSETEQPCLLPEDNNCKDDCHLSDETEHDAKVWIEDEKECEFCFPWDTDPTGDLHTCPTILNRQDISGLSPLEEMHAGAAGPRVIGDPDDFTVTKGTNSRDDIKTYEAAFQPGKGAVHFLSKIEKRINTKARDAMTYKKFKAHRLGRTRSQNVQTQWRKSKGRLDGETLPCLPTVTGNLCWGTIRLSYNESARVYQSYGKRRWREKEWTKHRKYDREAKRMYSTSGVASLDEESEFNQMMYGGKHKRRGMDAEAWLEHMADESDSDDYFFFYE